MAKVHRQLFERLSAGAGACRPARHALRVPVQCPGYFRPAVAYFRESAGVAVDVAAHASPIWLPARGPRSGPGRVAEARWVFSGPGSPTYALAQWRPTRFAATCSPRNWP